MWVVDGFPDYHREGCRELVGLEAEAVPHEQAVEDGFSPCRVCAPDAAEAPVEPTPAAIGLSKTPVAEPEPAVPSMCGSPTVTRSTTEATVSS